MKKLFEAVFKNKVSKVQLGIVLYSYEEEGLFYTVSPQLDLMGYGKSAEDAHASFQIVLQEYLDYATKKGTLQADLKALGWLMKKRNKTATPPTIEQVTQHNREFGEMLHKPSFKQTEYTLALPVFA